MDPTPKDKLQQAVQAAGTVFNLASLQITSTMASCKASIRSYIGAHKATSRSHLGSNKDHNGSEVVLASGQNQTIVAATGGDHHDLLECRDVLLCIFSHLDAHTILRVAALVNKNWRELAYSDDLWRCRAGSWLTDNHQLLSSRGLNFSLIHAHLALHECNFLRNPGLQAVLNVQDAAWNTWQRKAWVVSEAGNEPIAWECTPAGMPVQQVVLPRHRAYPSAPHAAGLHAVKHALHAAFAELFVPTSTGCIAATADWCEVVQVVDLYGELQKRGLSAEQAAFVLDSGLCLGLTILVGGRSDVTASFAVGLLLDEGGTSVPNIQKFVMRSSRYHHYSNLIHAPVGSWSRYTHVVQQVPQGCRRAVLILRGRASSKFSGKKGNLGPKFACPELVFVPSHAGASFGMAPVQPAGLPSCGNSTPLTAANIDAEYHETGSSHKPPAPAAGSRLAMLQEQLIGRIYRLAQT